MLRRCAIPSSLDVLSVKQVPDYGPKLRMPFVCNISLPSTETLVRLGCWGAKRFRLAKGRKEKKKAYTVATMGPPVLSKSDDWQRGGKKRRNKSSGVIDASPAPQSGNKRRQTFTIMSLIGIRIPRVAGSSAG